VRAYEDVLNQRSEFLVRQGCELQQAGVQPLQLALREGVEVDATNPLLGTRPLQPTKDLGGTRIGDRTFAQATLDLGVTRRSLCRRVARRRRNPHADEAQLAQGHRHPLETP
jgi:hypothetical protein